MTQEQNFAVILAAGRGTRMKSDLAKVLHPLLGKPMVGHVVDSAFKAGLQPVVVVHHQEERVRASLDGLGVLFARQTETRGTGDAVASALSVLPDAGTVVVMAGDAPLVRTETITALRDVHGTAGVTVLTANVEDPAQYGRLVRNQAGEPVRIVEAREASKEELAITEINTGLYCFDIAWLRAALPRLTAHEHKNEIYLTDTVQLAANEGLARVVVHKDFAEVQGVNDRWELACARQVLQRRVVESHARAGVDFIQPDTAVVDVQVQISSDVTIGPSVVLEGRTTIGAGSQVGAFCHLHNTEIGQNVSVKSHTVCESATVEDRAIVGPYARLRPGSRVCVEARVGNFVEMKNSTLGTGAKVNHLSYIGDAVVGEAANIGAGTITCNYDGFNKNQTHIGSGAFIGSNSALVAPVTVGVGAIIGAGSVITKSVPDNAVGIARGSQSNLDGAAERFRSRKKRK